MVDRNHKQPGVAWACQTCWKLYTAASSVERRDQQHRDGGSPCSGHGGRAFKVLVDHQGQPLPGQLPRGVTCPRAAPESVWASATQHVARSASSAATMPPPSAPTTAPAFILPTNATYAGATARRSLVVVLKYKRSETPSTTPHEPTTSESSGLIPPVRQSLVVIFRYRPPVPYTPPPPPSPATVAAYYPYPAPRTSTWSTDTAFGPPFQPGERDLPQFALDYWRSCWE